MGEGLICLDGGRAWLITKACLMRVSIKIGIGEAYLITNGYYYISLSCSCLLKLNSNHGSPDDSDRARWLGATRQSRSRSLNSRHRGGTPRGSRG